MVNLYGQLEQIDYVLYDSVSNIETEFSLLESLGWILELVYGAEYEDFFDKTD